MNYELEKLWQLLEDEINKNDFCGVRVYRRLDLEKETGIRISLFVINKTKEILIQVDPKDIHSLNPPRWMGMRFETIEINVPKPKIKHIRLFLETQEYNEIFTAVCSDIIQTLVNIEKPTQRIKELQYCLDRWTNFFKKYGVEGLSKEA